MSNHFHIVIELPRPEDLSNLMARWLGGYSRYYSKRHDYPGHVWQERFKSQPIQKEMYLLKCGRYVERNPYRAHIAEKPWDYEWSSCRYYVNGFNDNLTDEDLFYRGMGINPEERRKFYMNWLMEGEDTGFKGAMSCSGDKQFTSRLRYYKGRLIAKRKGMSPR